MQPRSLRSQFFSLMLSLSLPMILTACSAGAPSDDLKVKVQELESENATLKAEIAILKDTYAKAKTQEMQKTAPANGLPPVANQEAPYIVFADIEETPTKDMIQDLSKLHVFDESGSKFNPSKTITRAEYIEWLYKAYNALEPQSKQLRFAPELAQQFKDTPPSNPAYKYVQALANAGYSIGYDDGTFRPDKPLTREEMLGIKIGIDVGKTLPPWRAQMDSVWKFSDGKQVDERFTGYVHQDFYVSGPHGSNIQRAFGKIGTFRPKQAVLRYEAAATLWQMGQFGDTQNTNVAAVLKERENKS